MSDTSQCKYHAFISYSHRNDDWGAWLHKSLETYRTPKALVGKSNRDGKVPNRLVPIFQDVHELPTASDLGAMIRNALEQSRYLVVICSPAAAKSIWVNEEILTFKRLGKGNHILAIIVDGEPNATDMPGQEHLECFPPALRFNLDSEGNLTDQPAEPIAADARDNKGGKKNALLKLVAGLLGVNFDDLVQREKQRQKKRRLTIAAASLALLAGAGFGWHSLQQEQLKTRQANIDKLTSEAIKALDNDYIEAAMGKLSAAFAMQGETVPDADDPLLKRSFTVLNRANFVQKQRATQKINRVLTGLRVLDNNQLIAQDEHGNVHLFSDEGRILSSFEGVIDKGWLGQTSYHLDKNQRVLTLSTISNESVMGEDGIERYHDVFRSRRYDIHGGKQLVDISKPVELTHDGMFHELGTDRFKFYPADGQYYATLHTEYDLDGHVKTSRIYRFDTRSGAMDQWLAINKRILSLQYVEGTGLLAEASSGQDNKATVSGFYFARPADKQFTLLLPDNTVKVCNNGKAVAEQELPDKRIPAPRFGVTRDKQHILLLTHDLSGYRDYCLQSWDTDTFTPSGLVALKDFKNLDAQNKQLAMQVLDLETPQYRLSAKGDLASLDGNTVNALSRDGSIFANASRYGPDINIELQSGQNDTLKGHSARVTSMALNNRTGVLYSASEDLHLRAWNTNAVLTTASTGLDYINSLQVVGHSLLAIQENSLDSSQLLLDYMVYPLNPDNGLANLAEPRHIKVTTDAKKQVEARLLQNGDRLGIVINKPLGGFSVVRDDEPLPPPPPNNTFRLLDSRSGKLLATVEHDLQTYAYPAIQAGKAYFPVDDDLISLDLDKATTTRVSLADGYAVKSVIAHGDKLLVLADNRQDRDYDKRIHRLYLVRPADIASPQLLTEKKSQSAWFVSQDVNHARTLVEWDTTNASAGAHDLVETNGDLRKLDISNDSARLNSSMVSSKQDMIYVVNNGTSIAAMDFAGNPVATTFNTFQWFEPVLVGEEQYAADDDSFVALDNSQTCEKLRAVEGPVNISANDHFIRIGALVYDRDSCEVTRQLSVEPFADQVHLSDKGILTYANHGQLSQVAVLRPAGENLDLLRRWQAQRLLTDDNISHEKADGEKNN